MTTPLQWSATLIPVSVLVISIAIATILLPAWAKGFEHTAVQARLKTSDIEMSISTTPYRASPAPIVVSPPAPKVIPHRVRHRTHHRGCPAKRAA